MEFFLQNIDVVANDTITNVWENKDYECRRLQDFKRQNTLFFVGKKINQIFTDIFGESIYASIVSHHSINKINYVKSN